jgi:FtsP/CotA-like multicopper oxidase with cupredoxin domain
MKITRRSLLRATVATSIGGAVAGTRELQARSSSGQKKKSKRSRSGSLKGTGPFGYTPFSATFGLPPVLNDSRVDPNDGTIHNSVNLNPAPGTPETAVGSEAVYHGYAPEYERDHPTHAAANANGPAEQRWDRFTSGTGEGGSEAHLQLSIENSTHQFIPDIDTRIFGYASATQGSNFHLSGHGRFPAPTILARQGQPVMMRVQNNLGAVGDLGTAPECSVHLHGDHTPAHSDGYPDFYILPGRRRDYYYPNVGPRSSAHPAPAGASPEEIARAGNTGPYSPSDLPTTMWYHEHGMDVTGYLVSQGLAGFYLIQDDIELDLIQRGVLPPFYSTPLMPGFDDDTVTDIPLALMDQVFDSTGTSLPYNFLDHNGRLGDVFTVNGTVQPYFKVQRRKYRLRFLNASNARIYHLRLSHGGFIQLGQDSWEFPEAIATREFTLAMAQRVDAVVDFSDAPDEVYLENIMEQKDGRGPKKIDRRKPTPLMKFVVEGPRHNSDVSVEVGTQLRPFDRIQESEVRATRYFKFVRRNGAWQINNQFFSPRTTNAAPVLNSAERWIFENGGGGWWHPIHIHLEAHEIIKYNGKRPPPQFRHNVDVSVLEPRGTSEFLMKFRTFPGPFVFHCHNLEHEDIRMMNVFDPQPEGHESMNNGTRPHNDETFLDAFGHTYREISGMVENEEDWDEQTEGAGIFFDNEGDKEILEDRNVGFPATDFSPGGQVDPGPPGPDAPDNHDD